MTLFVLLPPPLEAKVSSDILDAPPGIYKIDPAHARVSFRISHLGFSYYTGRFDSLEGRLDLNNAAPEQSTLDVTVYPNSINLGDGSLEDDLRGNRWFDVIQHPRATFHVTKIERSGQTTGTITGELTLLNTTHSLVLDTTLIGTGLNPLTGQHVIGFSATGMLHRSDYLLTNLLPMIGDDVRLEIDAEFDKID